MWFDPGLAGLFITSTLLHLVEDINLLVVSAFNAKLLISFPKYFKDRQIKKKETKV
jgi:hypothetical protein